MSVVSNIFKLNQDLIDSDDIHRFASPAVIGDKRHDGTTNTSVNSVVTENCPSGTIENRMYEQSMKRNIENIYFFFFTGDQAGRAVGAEPFDYFLDLDATIVNYKGEHMETTLREFLGEGYQRAVPASDHTYPVESAPGPEDKLPLGATFVATRTDEGALTTAVYFVTDNWAFKNQLVSTSPDTIFDSATGGIRFNHPLHGTFDFELARANPSQPVDVPTLGKHMRICILNVIDEAARYFHYYIPMTIKNETSRIVGVPEKGDVDCQGFLRIMASHTHFAQGLTTFPTESQSDPPPAPPIDFDEENWKYARIYILALRMLCDIFFEFRVIQKKYHTGRGSMSPTCYFRPRRSALTPFTPAPDDLYQLEDGDPTTWPRLEISLNAVIAALKELNPNKYNELKYRKDGIPTDAAKQCMKAILRYSGRWLDNPNNYSPVILSREDKRKITEVAVGETKRLGDESRDTNSIGCCGMYELLERYVDTELKRAAEHLLSLERGDARDVAAAAAACDVARERILVPHVNTRDEANHLLRRATTAPPAALSQPGPIGSVDRPKHALRMEKKLTTMSLCFDACKSTIGAAKAISLKARAQSSAAGAGVGGDGEGEKVPEYPFLLSHVKEITPHQIDAIRLDLLGIHWLVGGDDGINISTLRTNFQPGGGVPPIVEILKHRTEQIMKKCDKVLKYFDELLIDKRNFFYLKKPTGSSVRALNIDPIFIALKKIIKSGAHDDNATTVPEATEIIKEGITIMSKFVDNFQTVELATKKLQEANYHPPSSALNGKFFKDRLSEAGVASLRQDIQEKVLRRDAAATAGGARTDPDATPPNLLWIIKKTLIVIKMVRNSSKRARRELQFEFTNYIPLSLPSRGRDPEWPKGGFFGVAADEHTAGFFNNQAVNPTKPDEQTLRNDTRGLYNLLSTFALLLEKLMGILYTDAAAAAAAAADMGATPAGAATAAGADDMDATPAGAVKQSLGKRKANDPERFVEQDADDKDAGVALADDADDKDAGVALADDMDVGVVLCGNEAGGEWLPPTEPLGPMGARVVAWLEGHAPMSSAPIAADNANYKEWLRNLSSILKNNPKIDSATMGSDRWSLDEFNKLDLIPIDALRHENVDPALVYLDRLKIWGVLAGGKAPPPQHLDAKEKIEEYLRGLSAPAGGGGGAQNSRTLAGGAQWDIKDVKEEEDGDDDDDDPSVYLLDYHTDLRRRRRAVAAAEQPVVVVAAAQSESSPTLADLEFRVAKNLTGADKLRDHADVRLDLLNAKLAAPVDLMLKEKHIQSSGKNTINDIIEAIDSCERAIPINPINVPLFDEYGKLHDKVYVVNDMFNSSPLSNEDGYSVTNILNILYNLRIYRRQDLLIPIMNFILNYLHVEHRGSELDETLAHDLLKRIKDALATALSPDKLAPLELDLYSEVSTILGTDDEVNALATAVAAAVPPQEDVPLDANGDIVLETEEGERKRAAAMDTGTDDDALGALTPGERTRLHEYYDYVDAAAAAMDTGDDGALPPRAPIPRPRAPRAMASSPRGPVDAWLKGFGGGKKTRKNRKIKIRKFSKDKNKKNKKNKKQTKNKKYKKGKPIKKKPKKTRRRRY